MKTKDIVVGAEYAAGQGDNTSAQYHRERVVIVEKGAKRHTNDSLLYGTSGATDGIQARVVAHYDGRTPDKDTFRVFRPQEIRMPWAEYEPMKAERDRVEAELADLTRVARIRAAAVNAAVRATTRSPTRSGVDARRSCEVVKRTALDLARAGRQDEWVPCFAGDTFLRSGRGSKLTKDPMRAKGYATEAGARLGLVKRRQDPRYWRIRPRREVEREWQRSQEEAKAKV